MVTHNHLPPPSDIPWSVIFLVAVWSIWTMRNKLVMEGLCFDSNSILKKIVSTATDLCYTLPSKINNSPKTMYHIGRRTHRFL